jgi:small GTP-binding protein
MKKKHFQYFSINKMNLYKILLIGDKNIGKTSILNRYLYNNFYEKQKKTIGIDFYKTSIVKNNIMYNLNIWDTSGDNIYDSVIKLYYRGLDVVLLIFDASDLNSLQKIKNWYDDEYKKNIYSSVKVIIVGTKFDLIEEKDINTFKKNIDNYFTKYNYFIMTSSKDNQNINTLFNQIIYCIEPDNDKTKDNIILYNNKQYKKRRKCYCY